MRNSLQLTWFVVALVACWSKPIYADEQLVPTAVSGDWAALEHRESLTAPPDICILLNPNQGLAIRASSTGIEVRIIDKTWSLPSGVAGAIQLTIGGVAKTLSIDNNSDTMVSANVSEPDILELFGAMDKASSMLVTAGKAKAKAVSLNGSSRASNAFRTCAGLAGNDKRGGDNPFQ